MAAPASVVLSVAYRGLVKSVSVFPPVNRQELLDALRATFGDASIGALELGQEACVLNDRLISEVLLKNPSTTYKIYFCGACS